MGRYRYLWQYTVAMCFAMALTGITAAQQIPSEIELRVTDHQPGIADFSELLVALASVSVHVADSARQDGWQQLIADTASIDIVPLKDGRFTHLTTIQVPANNYDAVRVRFADLAGLLHDGSTPRLSAKDTTVAADIDLVEHGRQIVLIDLYAENLTDHEPAGYLVKVREVRVTP